MQGPTYRNGGSGHPHYLGVLSNPIVHEDRKEEDLVSHYSDKYANLFQENKNIKQVKQIFNYY